MGCFLSFLSIALSINFDNEPTSVLCRNAALYVLLDVVEYISIKFMFWETSGNFCVIFRMIVFLAGAEVNEIF